MDANLGSGVSQDTGPQSNELDQPASCLGRLRVRASAPVRTLRQRRTAPLNIRLALIQVSALQAASGRLKRYARVVLSGPRNHPLALTVGFEEQRQIAFGKSLGFTQQLDE